MSRGPVVLKAIDLIQLGEYSRALNELDALDVRRLRGYMLARVADTRARALLGLGDLGQAVQAAQSAVDASRSYDVSPRSAADSVALLADLLGRIGDEGGARERWRAASELFSACGDLADASIAARAADGRPWPPSLPRKSLDRRTRLGILAVHGRHRSGTPWMIALRREILDLTIAELGSEACETNDKRYLLAWELVEVEEFTEAIALLDAISGAIGLPLPAGLSHLRDRAVAGFMRDPRSD